MRLRPSYAIALALAACGSEEAFEPQVGTTERLLDTSATAQLGSDNEGFDHMTVVGDLDGDGVDDAVIRTGFAYDLPDGREQVDGNIYIAYGGAGLTGKIDLGTLPYLTGAWGFEVGTAVAGVGDVDGDGLDDMLVLGARNMLCAGNLTGEGGDELRTGAYLVYGSRTRVAGEVQIAGVSTFLRDTHACTLIGGVTGLGDVDGDGAPDFAVTRVGVRDGEDTEVMAFYGRTSRLPAVVDLPATADARFVWPAGRGFLADVSGVGDVDGDGFADVMLRGATARVNQASLVRGSATRLAGVIDADTTAQTVFLGDNPCGRTDQFATALGDLDGDGAGDFSLLSCQGEYPGPQTVSHRVFYGRIGGFPAQVSYLDADATLPVAGTGFGRLAGGDVDGDGFVDLVVGDAQSHEQNGAVHLMAGDGTRLSGTIDPASRGLTYVGSPRRAVSCDFAGPDCLVHEHAGWDVSLGDLTGDGRLDLLIEAAGSFAINYRNQPGSAMDRAYVLSPESANP